jgi:hypothetical protein
VSDFRLVMKRSRCQSLRGCLDRHWIARFDDRVDVQVVELLGADVATPDYCPHGRLDSTTDGKAIKIASMGL